MTNFGPSEDAAVFLFCSDVFFVTAAFFGRTVALAARRFAGAILQNAPENAIFSKLECTAKVVKTARKKA